MSDLLNRFAELTDKTAVYPEEQDLHGLTKRVLYPFLGLAGEAGEVLNKFKKAIRDDDGVLTMQRRYDLKDELGDVLWYWWRACVELGYDPRDVIRHNIEKLSDRKERGTLKGEGDQR